MKAMYKKRWLAALRSGEYDKTKGCLVRSTKKGDSFCCLGVLEDIMGTEFVRRSNPLPWDPKNSLHPVGSSQDTTLTHKTERKTKLNSTHQTNLAELNDHSTTFASVIKYIEEKL